MCVAGSRESSALLQLVARKTTDSFTRIESDKVPMSDWEKDTSELLRQSVQSEELHIHYHLSDPEIVSVTTRTSEGTANETAHSYEKDRVEETSILYKYPQAVRIDASKYEVPLLSFNEHMQLRVLWDSINCFNSIFSPNGELTLMCVRRSLRSRRRVCHCCCAATAVCILDRSSHSPNRRLYLESVE